MKSDVITSMPIQSFDHSDVTGVFKVINAAGFPGELNFISITNAMNVPVIISFDGQYGHEYIKAYDKINLNIQRCCTQKKKRGLFEKYTVVYVKYAINPPKTGILTVAGIYQD